MNKSINKVIKSHMLLAVLSVVAVVMLTGGLTYALFVMETPNTENQQIAVGNLSANLTSISGKVVLNDLYPEEASNVNDSYTKYMFTVTNDGDFDIKYKIYLTDETTSFLADSANASYTSYKQIISEHYKYINYKLDGKTAYSNLATMETDSKTVIIEGTMKAGAEPENHYLQFFLDSSAPNDIAGSIISLDIHLEASIEEECVKSKMVALSNGLKANPICVTEYSEGVQTEMYTFDHPEAEQTTGWTDEERRDYRYIGNTPNNWIRFNDEDWRIIGVFTVEKKVEGSEATEKEQLIKIIRNESIGSIPWDDYTDGDSTNEWGTSSLRSLLNGEYYNTGSSFSYTYKSSTLGTGTTKTIPKGLNEKARSQVEEVKWYLGGSNTDKYLGGPDYYAFERGTTTYNNSGTTEINQRVGLMYPSDHIYTYGKGVDEKCYTNGYNCQTSNGGTPSLGWLYKSRSTQWTQSPSAIIPYDAFYVYSTGYVYRNLVDDQGDVRPTVFLKSGIKITSGDGSNSENAYILE